MTLVAVVTSAVGTNVFRVGGPLPRARLAKSGGAGPALVTTLLPHIGIPVRTGLVVPTPAPGRAEVPA